MPKAKKTVDETPQEATVIMDGQQEIDAVGLAEALPEPPAPTASNENGKEPAAPSVPTMLVEVDSNMPWGSLPRSEIVNLNTDALRVGIWNDDLYVVNETGPEENAVIGKPDDQGMQELAWIAGFPKEFVQKLSTATRATVINERLAEVKPMELKTVRALEGDTYNVSHFMRASRDFVPHEEIAQAAFNSLTNLDGGATVASFNARADSMRLRLNGTRQEAVTNAVGDILNVGIEVNHSLGTELQVQLFLTRLVCTNGMTAATQAFGWTQKSAVSRDHQLYWMDIAIQAAVTQFLPLVNRAREMAQVEFQGDPKEAIAERMRAMGIPRSMLSDIYNSFEQEPGNTEWHLLNAITRFATHNENISPVQSRQFQRLGGNWAENFDIVTARMPRPIAQRVGATILDISGEAMN